MIGQGKNVKATDTMIFDAEEGGGTLVTYRAEIVFSGASRFAEPLLKIVLNRVGADGAEGMRRALERFTDAPTSTQETPGLAVTEERPTPS
ncbi:MAG: hypothetical protein WKF51_06950 [Geodermatophilaceae bacterium]